MGCKAKGLYHFFQLWESHLYNSLTLRLFSSLMVPFFWKTVHSLGYLQSVQTLAEDAHCTCVLQNKDFRFLQTTTTLKNNTSDSGKRETEELSHTCIFFSPCLDYMFIVMLLDLKKALTSLLLQYMQVSPLKWIWTTFTHKAFSWMFRTLPYLPMMPSQRQVSHFYLSSFLPTLPQTQSEDTHCQVANWEGK